MENPNPRVYFDIEINKEPMGRMVMELDAMSCPKTAENFRALCTGEKGDGMFRKSLCYKGTKFFQVRPNFFCCGDDVVEDDGTSRESIFGKDFYEHPGTSFGGRDALSMCYIDGWTETDWMSGHYPVFGKVVDGIDLLEDIEVVAGGYGRQVKEVTIAGCGVY
ncbi:hypothetical protein Tsubulata_027448 [Turnera subulata]|uniref:Peptidyl-prolyl cis-trans isomerase n=1 Tax=Turnera subulata TaxID=218843 RepID=A0A9Q0FSM4_9ROSI|nr:hypothetical protein Tsubulata_027448 [Turnera subulata]